MGKESEKGKDAKDKLKKPADTASPIWHPQLKPKLVPSEQVQAPVKKQEKKQYLEEQLSIKVQSGSTYSYRVRHLEDGLRFSSCEKITKDGKTQELKHYAHISYDLFPDETLTFKFRGMNIEQIAEELEKLKIGNFRGGNGRMIYITLSGKLNASPISINPPTIVPRYVDAQGNPIEVEYVPPLETREIPVEDSTTSDTHKLPRTESPVKPKSGGLGGYRAPEPRVPTDKYGTRERPKLTKPYSTPDSSAAADDALRRSLGGKK